MQSRSDAEDFLRRFRRSLSSLPPDVRQDLVDEVRSHIEERIGRPSFNVAQSFGSPEQFAAAFLAEDALSRTVGRAHPMEVAVALLGGVRATAVTMFLVLPLIALEIMSLALIVIGFLKPLGGRHVGLFVQESGAFGALGWVSDPGNLREVMGLAAMPAFIFCGTLLFWISSRLLLRLAHSELTSIRSARSRLKPQSTLTRSS